jgi:hypothetical protein
MGQRLAAMNTVIKIWVPIKDANLENNCAINGLSLHWSQQLN